MDSKTDNQKIKVVIYGTIIIGLIIFSIQFFFFTKSKVEKELAETAYVMNKICPHEIDDKTVVESVYTSSKNSVGLNILLPEILASVFQTEFFKDSVYTSLKRQIKEDSFFMPFYKKNITITSHYYDRNAKLLFELTLKYDNGN